MKRPSILIVTILLSAISCTESNVNESGETQRTPLNISKIESMIRSTHESFSHANARVESPD